jgi:UDP-N-acetylglucosamine--N-acetylmuramyl-(pentapeptide) pyrophosphoryl-undecaprenol N-acetylglucosamine transferase
VTTGNPVRPAVLEAAKVPYQPSGEGEEFRLVVFGGSQGAQYFSKSVPTAISLLDDNLSAAEDHAAGARRGHADGRGLRRQA